jgi:hypothetical protein
MGGMINECNIQVGKPEGTKSLVRPRRIWKGNIKMDLTERGCKVVDWIYVAQVGVIGELL